MKENKAHIQIMESLDNISKKIYNEISHPQYYNLDEIFINIKNKEKEEQNKIFETLINQYLLRIKKFNNFDILDKNFKKLFDEILDMFVIERFKINNIDLETLYTLELEAECVSTDLILKLFGVENRTLTLPININSIIEFSINNSINQKYIREVIMLIIIDFAITYQLILTKCQL